MKKSAINRPLPLGFSLLLLVLAAIFFVGAQSEARRSRLLTHGDELLQCTSAGHILGFTKSGVYAAAGSHAIHFKFVNAHSIKPVNEVAARDTETAPPLSKVEYSNLWDGVTLVYDAPRGAIARSTYRIEPGADVDRIRLSYNAAVSLQPNGSLRIGFETGSMNESAPQAWQELDGKRVPIHVAFAKRGDREIGFTTGDYDRTAPLFIDPTLTWNTFLGSSQDDQGYALAVDVAGNIYVAGLSNATWGSPARAFTGGYDAFVAKLDSAGALIWNSFLGGTADEGAQGVAVDATGNISVAGFSNGNWGSPVRAFSGNNDAFAAKLDPAGNLIWNTFLGGIGDDAGQAVASDATGNVYVAGYSALSWGLPVRGFSGIYDAFAAKLDASGNLTWNTFLGGSGTDMGHGVAADVSGNVYVVGFSTASWSSPVRAFSNDDAFAAKLDSNGNLTWNTFLGGSGSTSGTAVTVDLSGNIYVSGFGNTTWGSPVRAFGGVQNAFAAKLNSGGALTWNTFLGGNTGQDVGNAIALDGSGNVYVGGYSTDSWGSPDRTFDGPFDAFAAKLDQNGNLISNTFVGGPGSDFGYGLGVDALQNVYVAGYSDQSWASPVRAYSGGRDAFAAQLIPTPISTPTPTPTPIPTPSPTPTPTPTPTPIPTPTPTPVPTFSGSFVIGNLNAVIGNHVTFWSSQWSAVNSLSAGPAPSSFNGFASDTVPTPAICGGAWTTHPGTSSAPPATVPPFITAIVSSSIAKSGSTVSGNIPAIVIIQTDPGYSPSSGHAGTGTVIAVVCQ